jgi:hypothetical protein
MTVNIDGKNYTYDDSARWLVQIGKNSSRYQTKYSFSTPHQAMFYYNSINIGRGYKKRLTLDINGVMTKVARMAS